MNENNAAIKTQVAEMQGWVLDWAVAQGQISEGKLTADRYEMGKPYLSGVHIFGEASLMIGTFDTTREGSPPHVRHGAGCRWQPSTDWDQAGEIIAEHRFALDPYDYPTGEPYWLASEKGSTSGCVGETAPLAAMRCYVTMKFGPEMDVPEEVFEQALIHDPKPTQSMKM